MLNKKLSAVLLAMTLIPVISYGPARADDDEGDRGDRGQQGEHQDRGHHRGWSKHHRNYNNNNNYNYNNQSFSSVMAQARAAYNQGNYDQAAVLFGNATSLNGNDVSARIWLGRTFIKLGRLAEAQSQLQTALNLQPNNRTAANLLAQVNARLSGNPNYNNPNYSNNPYYGQDPTVASLQQQLQNNPNDYTLHQRLAQRLFDLGRFQEAANQLNNTIALNPGYPEAHFLLGVTYAKLGQWVQAESELDNALRLRPGYPEATTWLLKVRLHQNT